MDQTFDIQPIDPRALRPYARNARRLPESATGRMIVATVAGAEAGARRNSLPD
mgnify:CR=1 FL=1